LIDNGHPFRLLEGFEQFADYPAFAHNGGGGTSLGRGEQ
jgi:hypothetical protein